ncbi:MAG: DNA mismatch endonuclease Vsr [Planctomycetia bacterium]|nr:DNA mismatch endonuclease Vsr [Planctomycetia bacterium]
MDRLSKSRRSWNMSRIRSAGTEPESRVEEALRSIPILYMCQATDLPGRPDFVLPRRRIAILVHGCYWHRHGGCKLAYTPKSRISFWIRKFRSNVSRDRRVLRELRRLGWCPIVIWECQTIEACQLRRHLKATIRSARRGAIGT